MVSKSSEDVYVQLSLKGNKTVLEANGKMFGKNTFFCWNVKFL